jgi:hypothetical protein
MHTIVNGSALLGFLNEETCLLGYRLFITLSLPPQGWPSRRPTIHFRYSAEQGLREKKKKPTSSVNPLRDFKPPIQTV